MRSVSNTPLTPLDISSAGRAALPAVSHRVVCCVQCVQSIRHCTRARVRERPSRTVADDRGDRLDTLDMAANNRYPANPPRRSPAFAARKMRRIASNGVPKTAIDIGHGGRRHD